MVAALSLMLAVNCASASVSMPEADDDSLVMRREADAFLASMPSGLQQRQNDAVQAALSGNCEALNEVRNSRNVAPDLSDGVMVRDLTAKSRAGKEIAMRFYAPVASDEALPLLIYFHGGGWTFGSLNSCARFCDAMAATGKVAVLAVDYSLAPEHPFPEGLEDCMAAAGYAFAHCEELRTRPDLISLGGDSSGGNLALTTAICLKRVGGAGCNLRSLVLFYPVVAAENDHSESWSAYASGYGLDADLMESFNQAYLCKDGEVSSPLISPAKATDEELGKLPPVLLVAAQRDILTSQGEDFAVKLSSLGNEVDRVQLPGTVHLFITVKGQERAFRRSVELTVDFLGLDSSV